MIHKFKAKDICILLDTNSGGVHVIDDVTFDLLDHAEPPFEKECPKNVMDILKENYTITNCYIVMMSTAIILRQL